MQKVEGSSPFIRFGKPAGNGGFWLPALQTSSDRDGSVRDRLGSSLESSQPWFGISLATTLCGHGGRRSLEFDAIARETHGIADEPSSEARSEDVALVLHWATEQ